MLYELHDRPSLDEPVMVMVLEGWIDAGYAAHDFPLDCVENATLGIAVVGQYVVLGSGQHWPGGTTAALRWFFR